MAGYFRQLAQQALQPAPRLHSTAGLPYSQDWRPEAVNTPSPLAGRSEQMGEPAVVMHIEQRTPHVPLGVMKQDEPAMRLTRSSPDTITDESYSPPSTGFHPALSSNAQATPNEIVDVTQTRNWIAPRSAPQTERHVAASVDARSEGVTASGPERLQPTPPPAAIRPQRPAAQSQFATPPRSTTPAPAPEVHIHIGRIELTAMPTAAPKRESAPAKKPMSLDEYLQRRHRSQSTGTP